MIRGSRNKIAIIGPYPPPYGGISVHIQRLLTALPPDSYHFYNIEKRSAATGKPFYGIFKYICLFLFLFCRYRIIHYHSTSTKIRVILSQLGLVHKGIYLHLHGASYSDAIGKKGFASLLLRRRIRNVNFLASNENLYKEIAALGPRSIRLIDAFIPPRFESRLYDHIVKNLRAPDTSYKLCMVGWFATYSSEDLYGFDLALDALHILRNSRQIDISIVASVNGIRERDRYELFLNNRRRYNLEDYFILITDDLEESYPLYLRSHIFIRPTNTDGNAVSVKEALWFGCTVVASDAVIRPEGVFLFRSRDALDLAGVLEKQIMENKFPTTEKKIADISNSEYSHPLISEVYGLAK